MSERQGGGPVKVTPEMIEAGLKFYRAFLADDYSLSPQEDRLVLGIYRAMRRISWRGKGEQKVG